MRKGKEKRREEKEEEDMWGGVSMSERKKGCVQGEREGERGGRWRKRETGDEGGGEEERRGTKEGKRLEKGINKKEGNHHRDMEKKERT